MLEHSLEYIYPVTYPPTYPLTTTRLRITPLTAQDAAAFVAYRQDPRVARWQGWEPSYSAADAAELIASQPAGDLPEPGGWLQLAIRNAVTGELYGDVAVHALEDLSDTFEIGITLAVASQHRGIAAEALNRILDHLFVDVNAHRVTANCDTRNAAVAKLLRTAGLRKESSQIDLEYFKGEWITLDGYAILRAEYAARS
jgi:RimJ/RimL family protein N-acetyltransferase